MTETDLASALNRRFDRLDTAVTGVNTALTDLVRRQDATDHRVRVVEVQQAEFAKRESMINDGLREQIKANDAVLREQIASTNTLVKKLFDAFDAHAKTEGEQFRTLVVRMESYRDADRAELLRQIRDVQQLTTEAIKDNSHKIESDRAERRTMMRWVISSAIGLLITVSTVLFPRVIDLIAKGGLPT